MSEASISNRKLSLKSEDGPSQSGTKKVPRIRALEILVLEVWTLLESGFDEDQFSETQVEFITRVRKLVAHQRDTEGKPWPESSS